MAPMTFDEIVKGWRAAVDPTLKAAPHLLRIQRAILSSLKEGRPASAEIVASAGGMPLDDVRSVFSQFRAAGLELDAEGSVVGAALTLNPTRHRFRVQGRELYAWCSLDTMFLPAFLDSPAEVDPHVR